MEMGAKQHMEGQPNDDNEAGQDDGFLFKTSEQSSRPQGPKSRTFGPGKSCSIIKATSKVLCVIGGMVLLTGAWTFVLHNEDVKDRMSNSTRNGSEKPTAGYPTDFLRDVVPIPCHSHNDYWRDVPLFSGIRAGCTGTEADVWLLDNHDDTTLYVGHHQASLTPERTFTSLYVDPLVALLNSTNPSTQFSHGTSNGVFDVDSEQTLVLLVDVKTDGSKTWPFVLRQLEPLRSRGWLTYVDGDLSGGNTQIHSRPITIVATGNTPLSAVLDGGNATYRDAFFDAPLGDLTSSSTAAPDYNASNSVYASTDFVEALGDLVPVSGGGLTPEQVQRLRGQVEAAQAKGLKARYWNTPAWPVRDRNTVWRALVDEVGVDVLNVDDLDAAAAADW